MISTPPTREKNLLASVWERWFSSVYDSFRNPQTEGDLIIDSSTRGLVLKDTAGHYWRVKISTAGALTTTDLGTTKPQGI